jgi:hypothetical protein
MCESNSRLRGEVEDGAIATAPGEGDYPRVSACRESPSPARKPDSARALPGARDLSPQAYARIRRHCEPPGRANARPMTGSAKQSSFTEAKLDCFVASAPRNDGSVDG